MLVLAFVRTGGWMVLVTVIVIVVVVVVVVREFGRTVFGGVIVGGREERLAQNKGEEDQQSAESLPPRTRACVGTVGMSLALPLFHKSLATETS